jgi:hypothetical protein
VRGAVGEGAVAVVGHDHRVAAEALLRERRADRDRHPGGHDAVRAEGADPRVGHVHRAALGAAEAAVARVDLGDHPLHLRTLGDHVAVAPVGRRDQVVATQPQADADRHGLLPDGHVHEPGKLALAVEPPDGLLERPDQAHRAVGLNQLFPPQRHLPSVERDRDGIIGMPSRAVQAPSRMAGRNVADTSHMLERHVAHAGRGR